METSGTRFPFADRMTWKEIEEYLKQDDRVILPIGAVEQHALHLAMGTDTITADAVSREAAFSAKVICYPPIWYGWSEGHLAYPGTASLRAATIIAIIKDIVDSLAMHGFRRFIVVSGHRRGNLPPLQIAANELSLSGDKVVAIADLGYLALERTLELRKSEIGGLGHADELETSHMMHLAPDLVDLTMGCHKTAKAPKLPTQFLPSDPALELKSRFHLPRGLPASRPDAEATGLGGDASSSTAEMGAELHAAFVDGLLRVLAAVKDHKLVTADKAFHR